MGKGGYTGGSTIIGPGSSWLHPKNPDPPTKREAMQEWKEEIAGLKPVLLGETESPVQARLQEKSWLEERGLKLSTKRRGHSLPPKRKSKGKRKP